MSVGVKQYLTVILIGFPCGSAGKESTCNVGGLGSIPGLGRCPGKGNGYPLQFLAWRFPWAVWSTGSQRVGHDWATFTCNKCKAVSYWDSDWHSLMTSEVEHLRSWGFTNIFSPGLPNKNEYHHSIILGA